MEASKKMKLTSDIFWVQGLYVEEFKMAARSARHEWELDNHLVLLLQAQVDESLKYFAGNIWGRYFNNLGSRSALVNFSRNSSMELLSDLCLDIIHVTIR